MVLVWNINLMTLGGTEMRAQPAEDESSKWGKVMGVQQTAMQMSPFQEMRIQEAPPALEGKRLEL